MSTGRDSSVLGSSSGMRKEEMGRDGEENGEKGGRVRDGRD